MARTYVDGLTDKTAVFNAIVDERALEFVGEFLRKADLIRWNLLNKKLDDAKAEMTALAQRTDEVYYSYNEDGMGLTFWGLDPSQSGISPQPEPAYVLAHLRYHPHQQPGLSEKRLRILTAKLHSDEKVI